MGADDPPRRGYQVVYDLADDPPRRGYQVVYDLADAPPRRGGATRLFVFWGTCAPFKTVSQQNCGFFEKVLDISGKKSYRITKRETATSVAVMTSGKGMVWRRLHVY